MRSVLCQEQRVCPSLPAPSPWFLLGQQEGPRLPEPQPALLGLSCHPHYEKFTRTNAQNMALNSPSRVTLLELLLLWESPKAHWQNGFTMSAYLQGLLRGLNEIKHPKMCLAHRQYQASWRPFLSIFQIKTLSLKMLCNLSKVTQLRSIRSRICYIAS